MGLLTIGSVVNIGALNVVLNQIYPANDRYIGWAMRF
jgi:serine acetyltransferase